MASVKTVWDNGQPFVVSKPIVNQAGRTQITIIRRGIKDVYATIVDETTRTSKRFRVNMFGFQETPTGNLFYSLEEALENAFNNLSRLVPEGAGERDIKNWFAQCDETIDIKNWFAQCHRG